jgi:hypothetical protein
VHNHPDVLDFQQILLNVSKVLQLCSQISQYCAKQFHSSQIYKLYQTLKSHPSGGKKWFFFHVFDVAQAAILHKRWNQTWLPTMEWSSPAHYVG